MVLSLAAPKPSLAQGAPNVHWHIPHLLRLLGGCQAPKAQQTFESCRRKYPTYQAWRLPSGK
eukprot:4899352-Amphidinium_carterae.1